MNVNELGLSCVLKKRLLKRRSVVLFRRSRSGKSVNVKKLRLNVKKNVMSVVGNEKKIEK